ncbi:MAG: Ig-like domain-containing protein [Prevotellaceae bacterium]|nr:Ig-like domain-containing protein [Prevotellaceae bacterium]
MHIHHTHEGLHIHHDSDNELQANPVSDFCNYANNECGIRISDNIDRALLFTGSPLSFATDICNRSIHYDPSHYGDLNCDGYNDGSCSYCTIDGTFGGACTNEFPSLAALQTAFGCIVPAYAMRPRFIYMQVNQEGVVKFDFSYSGGSGAHGLDADFAIWGPFDSKYDAFTTMATNPSWLNGPVACSNAVGGNTESLTVSFTTAHANKYFIMMIVPQYCANKSFDITITRNASSTGTFKSDVCNISDVSANAQPCALSKHTVTGAVSYTNPPVGGRLCITSSNTADTVYYTTYTSTSTSYSYTLNNIECTDETSDIIAWFEYPTGTNTGCSFTVCYQSPTGICPVMEVKRHNSAYSSACASSGDTINFTFKNAENNNLLDISANPVTFSYTVNGILETVTNYSGANPYKVAAHAPARYTGISVQTPSCTGTISSTVYSDTTANLLSAPVITGPNYVAAACSLNSNSSPRFIIIGDLIGSYSVTYIKPDGTTGTFSFVSGTFFNNMAAEWNQEGVYKFVARYAGMECYSDTFYVRRVLNSLTPGISASDTDLCSGDVTLSMQAPFRLQGGFTLELYKTETPTPITTITVVSNTDVSNLCPGYTVLSPCPFFYTVNSPGKYYVKLHTYDGVVGCVDTSLPPQYSDTIEITVCQSPGLTVSPSDTVICAGGSAILRANGEQGAIFKWYNSETGGTLLYIGNNYTVSPVSTTYYYVSQTILGIESERIRATVTVNALPSVSITGANSVCVSQTTQLTGAPSGGTWNSLNPLIATVDSDGLVSGISAGSVTIRYIVGSGTCIDSADVTVIVNTLPVVSITGSNSVCVSQMTQLTGAPSGGTWKSLNPLIATVDSDGLVSGISAGSVTIRYTVGSGTCIDSADVSVTIHPLYDITIYDTICLGDSCEFNGNSYKVAGIYTANLLSSAGCDSIITLDLYVSTSCHTQTINISSDYYEVTYGYSPFNINVTASSGYPLTFSLSGTSVNVSHISTSSYSIAIKEVGITYITFKQEGNNYYAPAEKTIKILVKPATLTITANTYTINVGDALPDVFGCRYSGFVYNQDSTVLKKLPVTSCSVINTYVYGEYPITVSGAEADNYQIKYINGVLKIKKPVKPLPNAFTPNQDEFNNIFGAGYDLYIFNRWGVCLYKGDTGWDGRNENGKMMAPGVYYYHAKDVNGNVYRGSVTLIK